MLNQEEYSAQKPQTITSTQETVLRSPAANSSLATAITGGDLWSIIHNMQALVGLALNENVKRNFFWDLRHSHDSCSNDDMGLFDWRVTMKYLIKKDSKI